MRRLGPMTNGDCAIAGGTWPTGMFAFAALVALAIALAMAKALASFAFSAYLGLELKGERFGRWPG